MRYEWQKLRHDSRVKEKDFNIRNRRNDIIFNGADMNTSRENVQELKELIHSRPAVDWQKIVLDLRRFYASDTIRELVGCGLNTINKLATAEQVDVKYSVGKRLLRMHCILYKEAT